MWKWKFRTLKYFYPVLLILLCIYVFICLLSSCTFSLWYTRREIMDFTSRTDCSASSLESVLMYLSYVVARTVYENNTSIVPENVNKKINFTWWSFQMNIWYVRVSPLLSHRTHIQIVSRFISWKFDDSPAWEREPAYLLKVINFYVYIFGTFFFVSSSKNKLVRGSIHSVIVEFEAWNCTILVIKFCRVIAIDLFWEHFIILADLSLVRRQGYHRVLLPIG